MLARIATVSSEANEDPDAALVVRMQAGDEAALLEVVRRHGPRLKALALRFCRNRAAADEVVQDTFFAAWRTVGRWQPGPVPFAGWLTRIAVNRSIDGERRGKLRRFFGLDTVAEVAAEEADAEAMLAGRGELAAVAADIRLLPARQRAAILLAAGGERTNAEIAAALGVSEGAAEQLLVRARRRLREQALLRDENREPTR